MNGLLRVLITGSLVTTGLTFVPLPAFAEIPVSPATISPAAAAQEIPPSLRNEAEAALDRGMAWLKANQAPEGHWSTPEFPALTGLAVWALARGGYADSPEVEKATAYLLSCVHENGAIYREPSEQRKGGGLANYNTAICMVALHLLNDPALDPVVAKARRFVAENQHTGGDAYRGGFGYDADTGRAYADLSNSYVSMEAMRLTEVLGSVKKHDTEVADLDWEAAGAFVKSLKNYDGGSIYKPGQSMAGTETNETGEVRFRSYGSMTYANLLSLIYANVNPSSPEVQSAFDWTVKHWSLEENPGMGSQGLYYFYNVLAKALAVYGEDVITLADGRSINWRVELIRKLLSLQRIDARSGAGYWVNEEGRWWEKDPVLVSAYALVALEIALGM